MKFEKINEKKLKITYSVKELEGKNIDPKKLTSNSEEAHDLILDMMESIEDKFDFDISANRLMIEASSTPENEFVLTVTNLEDEDRNIPETIVTKKLLKLKQQKEDLEKCEEKNVIVKFDSLESIVSFAKAVIGRYYVKSELYMIKNDYYLNIIPYKSKPFDRSSLLRISSDFGNYISNAPVFEGFLKEHAKKIISRQAIQTLIKELS